MGTVLLTRRALISSALRTFAGFADTAVVPASSIMRVRKVADLVRPPQASFVQRLFLDSRGRAIAGLEHAGWPADKIASELARRALLDMNERPWTASRIADVSSAGAPARAKPRQSAPSTTFSTKGRSWSG